jgi:FKBP-type peptidyl-prolyl cis-trans isomerase SlyD
MLVPGLESALAGMRAGDEREVIVPADAGYGDYDDELVLEIDRSELPNPTRVSVGDEFVAESAEGNGDGIALSVIEVREGTVVVDANHPLAGMTLRYHVKVRDVRLATDEEIKRAAADLDEAYRHVHGPDCGHEHEPMPLMPESSVGKPQQGESPARPNKARDRAEAHETADEVLALLLGAARRPARRGLS